MFQFLLKCTRFLFYLIITLVGLTCALFAILQAKWTQQKIKERLVVALQQSGIEVEIPQLKGRLPFSWTIDTLQAQTTSGEVLKLSGITFRIAILPLLKGDIVVNYLHVSSGSYTFSGGHVDAIGSWQENIDSIRLPFPLAIHRFSIDQMELIQPDRSWVFGATGSAKANRSVDAFHFDITLFALEHHQTYLDLSLTGNKNQNFIASRFKVDYNGYNAEGMIRGGWTTWQQLICHSAATSAPLEGSVRGSIPHLKIEGYPFLNRSWKGKIEFSLSSLQDISLRQMTLQSDLVQVKGMAQFHHKLNNLYVNVTAPDLSLFSPHLSGKADAKVVLEQERLNADVDMHELHLNAFDAGNVEVTLTSTIQENNCHGQSRFTSLDTNASLEFAFKPDCSLSLSNIHLDSNGITAQGFLDYDIERALYEGAIIAHVEELERWSALFTEKLLSGKLDIELILSVEEGVQSIGGALVCDALSYDQISLDSLNINGHLKDIREFPQGKFNLLATKIYGPGLYVDRLHFNTYFDEIRWPFYLNMDGKMQTPFTCDAQGFWQKENQLYTLELASIEGALGSTVLKLKQPALLEWKPKDFSLSPFYLNIGSGSLFATCELNLVRSVGEWKLEHFPLEVFSCLHPPFGLKGLVSMAGFIDAAPETTQGALSAFIEEASVLHFGKQEPLRTRGSIEMHLQEELLQTQVSLVATDQQFLDFHASIPVTCTRYPLAVTLNQTKNMTAELFSEGKLQDLFDFVNLGTNHLTGLLSCRLFLSDTLQAPSVHGKLSLQNGSYENYFTGIHLRHIDAECEAFGKNIVLKEFHAKDDKSGSVEAEGNIFLEPGGDFPYVFEAELYHLHTLRLDMIDCDFSGPLYFTGNTRRCLAQGNLLIDDATIQIGQRLPYEILSLPVTYINMPKYLPSYALRKKNNFEFDIDLELSSDNHVHVEGKGMNAELGGNLHVYGKNTSIAASGSLNLVKGEYLFSGKVFQLTEGEILFNDKPSPSAYLNISGTTTVRDITVTASMRGPLRAPQLCFTSNPQKPTSSILSLILFDKEASDIDHPEAIQLAQTLMSLSGGAGPDVLESIRKSIGIDRLNISSDPDSSKIALQIGKYLTRGIMITLSQSATSSQVIVEVELPKGFIFQAETQEQEEGKFTLKWRKSY